MTRETPLAKVGHTQIAWDSSFLHHRLISESTDPHVLDHQPTVPRDKVRLLFEGMNQACLSESTWAVDRYHVGCDFEAW
jgi:hypothetical protein